MEDRLRLHYDSLARLVEFIKTADAKAVPLLASHTVLLGALAARFGPLWSVLQEDPDTLRFFSVAVLSVSYLVFAVAAIVVAARVFFPFNPPFGESLIYFQDISGMPYDTFVERSQQLSPGDIEKQLLHQIFHVSGVVKTKMYRVRWAFLYSIPTVMLWLVLISWGSWLAQSTIETTAAVV